MKILFIIFILLYLSACDFAEQSKQKPASIKIDDDLYYAPVDKGKDGCTGYQITSKTKATIQMIIYQNNAGEFATDKNQLNCL
ncbi:MAG: hypothetical protein FXV79_05955 [Candidatus Thioglobus sp.]|nr:MAG: hypothetical protein FXV79_05955 [Candidatus Thioglobus sp.]KAA0445974.1 MAG: hypothetical protein FXV80_01150 [Candidatus Thioglobus sp.]